jgi:hypothetical protein
MEASVAEWASDYNMEVKTKYGLVFLGDWIPDWGVALQWVMWIVFAILIVRTYIVLDRLPDPAASVSRATWETPSPAAL